MKNQDKKITIYIDLKDVIQDSSKKIFDKIAFGFYDICKYDLRVEKLVCNTRIKNILVNVEESNHIEKYEGDDYSSSFYGAKYECDDTLPNYLVILKSQ